MSASRERGLLALTAFLEGLAVLLIEIAGARALAPYFGSALNVWTAQITATLLFLALGYVTGARFCRSPQFSRLSYPFWLAGLWLCLYPFLRNSILISAVAHGGVTFGSFLASWALFGIPLLCLGALSPLMVSRLEKAKLSAGQASGEVFFYSTLGGLGGGWLTALVLIPHFSLRLSVAALGIFLVLLGCLWRLLEQKEKAAPLLLGLVAFGLFALAPRPSMSVPIGRMPGTMLESRESGVGLVQVLQMGDMNRALLIDGVTQGGMAMDTGTSCYEFTEYLNFLGYRYAPQAKSALLLGLGSGMLAKALLQRGLSVTAAEIDPEIIATARSLFGLPSGVQIVQDDARHFLNQGEGRYDLIFLDAYAGENAPWYLATEEAFQRMKAHLNPGGEVLINIVTLSEGAPGQDRLESTLLKVFGACQVYTEAPDRSLDSHLVNATLLAGEQLKDFGGSPDQIVAESALRSRVSDLMQRNRPAKAGAQIMTDDESDLDYAEAPLKAAWRALILRQIDPSVLSD